MKTTTNTAAAAATLPLPDRKLLLAFSALALLATTLLAFTFINAGESHLFCTSPSLFASVHSPAVPLHLRALLHYATSKSVPQQTLSEISLSFRLLRRLSPCNFLVFGLGHDSLMWASFNPRGKTLFLEEDPKWVKNALRNAPDLHAVTVRYRTRLYQADDLMKWYKSEAECGPNRAYLRGNERCKLAITGLPEEVYDTEWDVVMIDAPRGRFGRAPGRMAAIYSAAVMGRRRRGEGVTHVFLHDVDRKVEKGYAEEFLCKRNLKEGVGRLWHFEVPPAPGNVTEKETAGGGGWC